MLMIMMAQVIRSYQSSRSPAPATFLSLVVHPTRIIISSTYRRESDFDTDFISYRICYAIHPGSRWAGAKKTTLLRHDYDRAEVALLGNAAL